MGPSERGPFITEKVKFTFYYEVILDILGYFHFLLHCLKCIRKLKRIWFISLGIIEAFQRQGPLFWYPQCLALNEKIFQ